MRLLAAVVAAGRLCPPTLDLQRFVVEPPRDAVAWRSLDQRRDGLRAGSQGGRLEPARARRGTRRCARRNDADVEKAEVAGPGFINIRLKPERLRRRPARCAERRRALWAQAATSPRTRSTSNMSAPIRPGRCMSATRAARCSATRWRVCSPSPAAGHARILHQRRGRAGRRARPLGLPALSRGARRDDRAIPEGLYPGDYLKPVGEALAREFGAALARQAGGRMAAAGARARHRRDDGDDPRRSRRAQHRARRLLLRARADRRRRRSRPGRARRSTICARAASSTTAGCRRPRAQPSEDWEDREQTLFRSTDFGDDVDRPLIKSDGGYTYFASDIAYHKTKIDRGFLSLVDVWGADHGGYVKRMQAAVAALSGGKAPLDVRLCQLVRLMRAGEPVKMSKRSGDFVTLREVVDEVGADAVRFIMLMRKNDAHARLRPRQSDRAEPGQSGLLRAIRACARAQRVAAGAGRVSRSRSLAAALARADFALLDDEGERGLMRALANSRASSLRRRRRASRTASRFMPMIWPRCFMPIGTAAKIRRICASLTKVTQI